MSGRASIPFVLLFLSASLAPAQPVTDGSQFQLGKAAMDKHDPAAAIAHFEKADSTEARAWLAVALMMESRSPSDRFVERAFDAAARSRANQPDRMRSRADLAAALRPGEMVVTFLVAESHAYAWAFDRDTLIGYPLPPPAEIAVAVERINAYVAQNDRAGVERIADDLMPALLGPVVDRIPTLTRAIFVMHGPLQQLSIGELSVGEGRSSLSERLAVSVVDDESLFDEIERKPSTPQTSAPPIANVAAGGIIVLIVLVAGIAALRRRSSIT